MYCDEQGIKYIHGVEIYLTARLLNNEGSKIRDNYHTILLAKNYEGVKEINRLCYIASQPDHFYYKPRLSFEEFLGISDNVIKISACIASPLNEFRKEYSHLTISPFHPLLTAYDYLELQPHDFDEQIEYNYFLYDLSNKFNIPLIMGTDTHSLNEYKAECRTIFQFSQEIEFAAEDSCDLTYKTYDQLANAFRGHIPEEVWLEAIENTNVMADSVEPFDLDTSFKYPPLYDNDEEVLWDRLRKKYVEKRDKGAIVKSKANEYGAQIKEEMRVFKKLGMCGFMLFMSELISWCWEHNIPVGFGRGSCCGSTVAYISDITDVDPIVWNTMFARFCNEYRVELGDIDCDFSPDQRDDVFQYIVDRFGLEYTGYVFSNGTLQEKGAIAEICKGLNNKWKSEHGYKLKDKVEDAPYPLSLVAQIKKEYEADAEATKKKYPDVFYYLDGMNGIVKSSSYHPAGMIASPINLIDHYGGFVNEKGQTILPINMEECHEVNLVKFDILGLTNVQVIRDACRLANIPYPKSYQMDWNDQDVWADIITSPTGIFQMESKFAFESLKKFEPHKLDDMTLVTASIRPSGESYRDSLLNHECNTNPSEQIDELLKDNNGFLVYQEDVIRFLQEICGLSGSEADNVRRAIGRKQVDRLEAALPQILEGYCNKSDKPREVAEQEAKTFLQIIEDASSYMFGRNHATAYSMIGYVCGWLRYYYPLEFITSFLNNANTDDDTINGTKLAQSKGFTIKAPKFGYASNGYTCDKEQGIIYKGLGSIKDMQNIAADIMTKVAEQNPSTFLDVLYMLEDIKVDNKKLNKASLEILTKIGFFDCFDTIHRCLAITHWFNKIGKKKQIAKDKFDDWLMEIISQHCEKEIKKQFKGLNGRAILEEILSKLPNDDEDVFGLIKNQVEYLGYADVGEYKISPNIYIVQKVHTDMYKRTWVQLYQIYGGAIKEYEVDKGFVKDHKIIDGDILKCVFGSKPIYTKTDNGWKKTNNLRTYLKFYSRMET